MLLYVLLEVCGMPKLFIAVGTVKPRLFLVDCQDVIFKTVLPGEGGLALVTFEGLLSRVEVIICGPLLQGLPALGT